MKTGDLILIKSQKEFDDSVKSFHDKWASAMVTVTATARLTRAVAMATAMVMAAASTMAMAMATSPLRVTTTNKKTNETIKLKYHGYDWKYITFPFIGIIAEIIPEGDHDFDVFKIFHDNEYFYCRRMIIEGSVK